MNHIPPIRFDPPLSEGVILKRKSQFTMLVDVLGKMESCHCPTTGRIGNIDLAGRPCLLSKSSDPSRKTPYTVEAVSLNGPGDDRKSWIGINQNAVNRYVEHYLSNGGLGGIADAGAPVLREQFLGPSKLDFLAGDTYVEVKTPLQTLQVEIPPHVKTKKATPFSHTDRLVRHIGTLADSLQSHQRAVLLICFMYDNPGFRVIDRSEDYERVSAAVYSALDKGVESWQANFEITPEGVRLEKHFRLSL